MPRGRYHELSGILLRGPSLPVPKVDDGGEWWLDVGRGLSKLDGWRFQVTGTRADFDIIDVRSMRAS